MAKMPFFQFYPLDWLRDTAKLSPASQGQWVKILCIAWNEPDRGVYKRTETAACYELGLDPMGLKDLLEELLGVAEVTFSNDIVTVKSRRMVREENEREQSRIRVERHRSNAKVTPVTRLGNASVTDKKLEVRSQKSEETPTPPPLPPRGGFELVWAKYPNKDGKTAAARHYKRDVKTMLDFLDLQRALDNYLKSDRVKRGFVKNGSTWFNNWRDWINYTEVTHGPNDRTGDTGLALAAQRAREARRAQGLRKVSESTAGEVLAGIRDHAVDQAQESAPKDREPVGE